MVLRESFFYALTVGEQTNVLKVMQCEYDVAKGTAVNILAKSTQTLQNAVPC